MKRIGKILIIILIIVMLLGSIVHGNSAVTRYSGSDGYGIYTSNCPLEVVREELYFSLNEEPVLHYPSIDAFLQYGNYVQAQYEMHNPTDDTLTATFAFPFGNYPFYRPDNLGNRDAEKYHVYADGVEVKTKLRYTYMNYNGIGESDMAVLNNEEITYDFFYKDMPIAVYTFTVSNIDNPEENTWLKFHAEVPDNTKMMLSDLQGISYNNGKLINFHTYLRDSESVLYVFNNTEYLPEYQLEDSKNNEVKGDIEVSKKIITFNDFVNQYYDKSLDVPQYDYYHGFVSNLIHLQNGQYFIEPTHFNPAYYLMRWYQYEITFAPGQTITNTVQAPIYPTIDEKYAPSVYSYTYLLSPARTFSSFGNIDITIETPLKVTYSAFEYETTDKGYHISLESIPDRELTFELCETTNPGRHMDTFFPIALLFAGIVIVLFIILVIILKLIIKRLRKRKDRPTG